jgi:hypothetical protein
MQAWLKDHLGEIVRTIVLALVGAAGVILSPIRDELEDWIRPETVSIALQAPDQVTQGNFLDVSCIVLPQSSSGVSGGLLQFGWEPANSFQPISAIKSLPVQQLKQPSELPATPWRLRAERPGDVILTATFINRKARSIKISKRVSIVHPDSTRLASEANYTSRWQISIKFAGRIYHGQLDIQDENYDLIGRYRLSSGERGHLTGRHDGGKFWLELETGGNDERWHLDGPAPMPTKDGFLATNGTCALVNRGGAPTSKATGTFNMDTSSLSPPQH